MPELERAKLPHVPNLAGSNRRDLQSDNQVHGRTLVRRLGSDALRSLAILIIASHHMIAAINVQTQCERLFAGSLLQELQ